MNTPAPWSSVSSICLCINQARGPGSLRLIPGAWQGTKTGCQVCWGRLNKQSAFCKVVSQNLCSAEHFVFREVTFPGTKASSMRLSSLLKHGSNVHPGNRCYQLHGAKPGFKINSQPVLLEMVLGKHRSNGVIIWAQVPVTDHFCVVRLTLHGWMSKLISEFLIDVIAQNKMGKH